MTLTNPRVGLLGGSFDPVHMGHLWLAETAVDQLHLDAVWFLPVGHPPHKTRRLTAVAHRLQMAAFAIADAPAFHLNRSDVDRLPPHTTHTLLSRLHQQHPDHAFWLLIGADSLRDFPSWKQPQAILQQCRLAALGRPGVLIDWAALETAVPGIRARTDWLGGPTLDISATAIRAWARNGRSLKYLVPDPVRAYIGQHRLYKTNEPLPR